MNNFIAHRGNGDHEYKENTIDAILTSLTKDYISGVEFDVRLTKDNKVVVIHNKMINHVSDGWGFVKHMTIKELRKYNFGTKKNPAKIATLEAVLRRIDSDKKIVIDIKEEADNYKLIVKKIYNVIKKYNNLNLYICSFDHKLINYFKNAYPNYRTGSIFLLQPDFKKTDIFSDFYLVNYKFISDIVGKKEVMIWTVNSKEVYNNIKKYITINMSIITDNAYLLTKK